jgi:hypothetical protein
MQSAIWRRDADVFQAGWACSELLFTKKLEVYLKPIIEGYKGITDDVLAELLRIMLNSVTLHEERNPLRAALFNALASTLARDPSDRPDAVSVVEFLEDEACKHEARHAEK